VNVQPFPVLIVGSTGAFGSRIAELLRRSGLFALILCGRNHDTLEAQAAILARDGRERPATAVLDAATATGADIVDFGAALVINASGPFQGAGYSLALAAIAARCHYVDLADSRSFVKGFTALDREAKAAGVLAVSGASSVPGLSSAVVSHVQESFAAVRTIDIAISPGNAFDPGVATVRAVLGGVGQPLRIFRDQDWHTVHGWQGLRRADFGDAGRRWVGHVDVPDFDLFTSHIPGIRSVRFQAGLEVALFHLGLWASSWLVRGGLVRSLAPLAPHLLAVKRRLRGFGSDCGGMTVEIGGLSRSGTQKLVRWELVAKNGHGPYVPALASVAIARRHASGQEKRTGARACYMAANLANILAEAEGLDIATSFNEKPLPP
jgi:saccharopine dehydrogenase-like NADP-dependent oxidoreductase